MGDNFRQWFNEFGDEGFIATGDYFVGDPRTIPIAELLWLKKIMMNPFTIELLDMKKDPGNIKDPLLDLSMGIRAYFQFQDILDLSLEEDHTTIFNRHYCYYESIVYLRESIKSWAAGNFLSSMCLIRPLLELSLLQVYWHLKSKNKSYDQYFKWLHKNKKIKFVKILHFINRNIPEKELQNKTRLDMLFNSLKSLYSNISAYNHGVKLQDSTSAKKFSNSSITYDDFLYNLIIINNLLRQLVYLYILTYPMSLFPVDKRIKWGYSEPLGVYVDNNNYDIIEKYIRKENIQILKKNLSKSVEVNSLLDWYDKQPDLTDNEIEATWVKSSETDDNIAGIKDFEERIAHHKAKIRTLGWAFNYINNEEITVDPIYDDIDKVKHLMNDWF